jgi:hypothetical protein
MSDENTAIEGDQSQQSNESGPISRMIGVFFSPQKTFESIGRKPDWLIPFIVILVLALVSVYFMQPVIMSESLQKQQEKMEERGMSAEQMDVATEQAQKVMKFTVIPSAIIVTALNFVVGALIWLFVGNIILGGAAKFKQVFAVNVYRSLITTIGGLIKLPIILSKETLNVHFSLATFMSDEMRDSFVYKVLAQTDIFNVWSIGVLCIGLAAIYKFKVAKVWPVVVIIYVAFYLASSAIGGLF